MRFVFNVHVKGANSFIFSYFIISHSHPNAAEWLAFNSAVRGFESRLGLGRLWWFGIHFKQ